MTTRVFLSQLNRTSFRGFGYARDALIEAVANYFELGKAPSIITASYATKMMGFCPNIKLPVLMSP